MVSHSNLKMMVKIINPSTNDIINISQQIRSKQYKDYNGPLLILLDNDEFVLTESSIIIDLPVGSWAVFKKYKNQYFLTALIDFR